MASEGEHGEGDEGFWALDPKRDAGDEADLGIGRFDEPVPQAGVEGGPPSVVLIGSHPASRAGQPHDGDL